MATLNPRPPGLGVPTAGRSRTGSDPALADLPDLADPAFWRLPAPQRFAGFARLRELERPVFFPEPGRRSGAGGFWALVRHSDVVAASRNPGTFRSEPGVTTPPPPRWVRTVFGDSMVNLDDPRHAWLRGTIARAFTPRRIAAIEDDMQRVAANIVEDVARRRPDDFVTAVASQMPFQVICNMMGIPAQERAPILAQVDRSTAYTGMAPRRLRLPGRTLRALAHLHRMVARTGRQRRREPTDDLISALVLADVDGSRLTGRELGAFFSLLLVAGVETTRNAIAHGLTLLTEHPDQRALLWSDFDRHAPGFVDEVARYSTPIIQFRRTLAHDHVLGGCELRAGTQVMLVYSSANRDERVFDDPDRFDLTRSPNPHVGFGGGGPHFCLGASLARMEMTVLFRALRTSLPEIRAVGPARLVPSNFDNRVGYLPFTVSRRL